MTNTKSPLVLISGASQGIGAAIARCFADSGLPLRLALVARTAAALQAVARECSGAEAVATYTADVSDEAQVLALKAQLDAELGPVSVLINNAGRWLGKDVVDMSAADFDSIVATNLRSTFLLTRMVLPAMLTQGRGDIYNMVSTAGVEGYAGVSAYCAAKHGVQGFSRALREEMRGKDIRVCTVSPGATYSPSWHDSGVSTQSLMPAEEVARAFLDIYRMDRRVVVEDMVLRPSSGHIVSN